MKDTGEIIHGYFAFAFVVLLILLPVLLKHLHTRYLNIFRSDANKNLKKSVSNLALVNPRLQKFIAHIFNSLFFLIIACGFPALAMLVSITFTGDSFYCKDPLSAPSLIVSPMLALSYFLGTFAIMKIVIAGYKNYTDWNSLFIVSLSLLFASNFIAASLFTLFGIDGESTNWSDVIYFSLINFTTVGFGDIAPCSETRLLSALHGLCGLICAALGALTIGAWHQKKLQNNKHNNKVFSHLYLRKLRKRRFQMLSKRRHRL